MLPSAFSEVLSSLNYRTMSKNSHGPTKMEQMRSLELKKEEISNVSIFVGSLPCTCTTKQNTKGKPLKQK